MTRGKLILFFLLAVCQGIWAQQDSIALKEVIVSDVQLQKFSSTQQTRKLNDSVLALNQPSLTSLLNYNSALYFKENGLGMVSSPSFRGTTAQQTAVIWNGININSQLSGQTDFNTVTARDFENITLRSGGGSAIYGSSAIGGSIHLSNDLHFGNAFNNEFQLGYGSFETYQALYKVSASNEKVSVNAGISHNRSQNDYPYIGSKKDRKNENGQFCNTGFNLAFGYRLSERNYLKLFSQLIESERHFSGTTTVTGKSKYQDLNSRNLIEWAGFYGKFTSKLKLAALSEKYKYFDDADREFFSTAKAETYLARYDAGLKINDKIYVNALLDYTQTKGFGSDIGENKREIFSAAALVNWQITSKINYEASLRKEATSNYKSPMLFATGLKIVFSKVYLLRFNFSRNFRIPTFNDLYWNGSGNADLNPESSYQGEAGQELKLGNFILSATAYYIDIKNMLRWVPGANAAWSPENVDKVKTKGVETGLNWKRKSGRHHFDFSASYGYVASTNPELDKQLIYVPYHKGAASAAYHYRRIGLWYQFLYNGSVYTSSDNFYKLDEYQVSNIGLNYDFGLAGTSQIGLAANNLLDQAYESVSKRPMPGRNYTINLIFKF